MRRQTADRNICGRRRHRPHAPPDAAIHPDDRHDRDALIRALHDQAIQTRPVWALIHQQADYGRNEAHGMEKAEDYRAHIVNLPCSTNLSQEDAQRVVDVLLGL